MGTWSEDKLKSLRSQYNFEKRAWPNAKPEVPQECELDSRGILQWKGGKRPVVHSGYWVDPKSRAKDSTFKPGDHVVIQAGYGGKGGQAGQDFKRFSSDTPAIVTDIAGGDIYVRPEGDNYKWKVQAKALVEGTAKASARDADRRSRLHRALDAVIDSCGTRAKDAEPTLAQLTKKIESLKNKEDAARGRVGLAVEARKRLRGKSGCLQSPREMKARHALSDIQSELMSAELALRNLTQ